MTNRRDFLKASAGFLYVQAATPKRREVSIGKRRAKVIDIHGHFVAPEELEVVKDTPLARSVSNNIGRSGTDQQGSLVLGPERLRVLDEASIDIQVLSHQGGWWYGADRDLARRIVNVQNQKLAEWCSAHSDRFAGLASVALQHPEMAAEQLEEAVKKLGLKGVGIAGHAGGEVPFSPKYDPFWAKVQELGVLCFVHPGGADNVLRDGALRGRGDLGNTIGNPLETTVFLSHLIFEGTLDRFPGLKICSAHAGGYLPSYSGRSDALCGRGGGADCKALKKKPSDYFREQLYIDSMIFREEGLRHLVAEVGVGHMVYGTDYPFDWPIGIDFILNAPFLSNADKEAILGGNLIKLLRITS